jgi:hypothetical protein
MGSVLLDLQILTETNSAEIAWIFPSKSLGLLTGIVLIYFFFKDRLAIVILVGSWVFAVSVAVTSLCTNLYVLIGLTFLHGSAVVSIWVGKSSTLLLETNAKKLGFVKNYRKVITFLRARTLHIALGNGSYFIKYRPYNIGNASLI